MFCFDCSEVMVFGKQYNVEKTLLLREKMKTGTLFFLASEDCNTKSE